MKLTPFLLFLLLLVVLIVAVITLKPSISLDTNKEGFISFQTNVVPQREVKIPPYSSKSVVKLYDNLFFDRSNANVIEVIGPEFTGNIDANYAVIDGNVDSSGNSITAINVKTRDGTITNYTVTEGSTTQETRESTIQSITSSYNVRPFYTTACKTTGTYQLFYIPWNTDTYIHAIQITDTPSSTTLSTFRPKNIFTYNIPADSTKNINAILYRSSFVTITPTSTPETNTSNNTMVTSPLYSTTQKVYQLSPDIKYNIKNGDLIVDASGSILVYNRQGVSTTYTTPPTNLETDVTSVAYAPWIVNNTANTIQILYVQSRKNTLVALFRSDSAGRFVLLNYGRFNENNIDNGDGSVLPPVPTPTPPTPDSPIPDADITKSAISDYFKWYWYWNSSGPGMNPKYSDNYMLKTQIVPPVCPSCPAASCGSSSSENSGKSGNSDNVLSKTVDSAGNAITKTVDTAGNVVNKTIDTTGNVVNKTVDTASDLLKSGASGASNLLTSGASGAVNLLTSGVSGATDLLKDAGSGAVSVVDKTLDTTGNVLNRLSGNNVNTGTGAYYGGLHTSGTYRAPGFSQGNPPIDNYSYYGALPNKGSDYIPITADFSAFKK